MSTLTDRYAWAVVHRLPAGQRNDIEQELRSTISDMQETQSEREALIALGDPARFAANYRNGRSLIGAELYPTYVGQLRGWLLAVVPIFSVLAAIGAATSEDPTPAGVVLAVVGGATTAAVQACFWVTLVFAAIERFGEDEPEASEVFDPDALPPVPAAPRVTLVDAVAEVVLTLFLISVLVLQRSWSPARNSDGQSIPVLNEDLWTGPMWMIIALLVASVVVVLVAHGRGAWSWPPALAITAINLALFALIAWAAFDERLVNPAFLAHLSDEFDRTTPLVPNPAIIVLIVGAILLIDIAEAISGAVRNGAARTGRP